MTFRLQSFRPAALPLALACAFCAHAAQDTTVAQLAAPSLPDTVVTATRVAQPLTDVLADVTVLGDEQIRASGAVTIGDLLARQPGLELS
ncbi:MAG TPA: TonB-dependent receptor, partial [Ottowia sp.]|nr:TonB-dependent receptor [Ottowia sp.]